MAHDDDAALHAEMTALVAELAPAEGMTHSLLDGVAFGRSNKSLPRTPVLLERIRSRGQVHRRLAQFTLSSEPATLPLELTASGETAPAGRITSTAVYKDTRYGLGIVRSEAVERHPTFDYPGGVATLVHRSPLALP